MIKSIMCCCGSGLGSSMLVRMNVEKTLQKIGVSGVSVTHSFIIRCSRRSSRFICCRKRLRKF